MRADANVIVAYNLKDFMPAALAPHGIDAHGPSAFLKALYAIDPEAVLQTLEEQAAAIGRPLEYLLRRLRVSAPGFVAMMTAE